MGGKKTTTIFLYYLLSIIWSETYLSYVQFQETLHIYGPESTLHVNLLGRGVNPTIDLNLEEEEFDMGAVLVNEYMERVFTVWKNTPWNME